MRGRCALVSLAALGLLPLFAVRASGTTPSSGLYGKVLRGPVTPVCTVETPCYVPASAVTLVFARSGRESGRAVTDKDGKYRIRLTPGTYSVRRASTVGRPVEPDSARVPIGHVARVDFKIDTGIR